MIFLTPLSWLYHLGICVRHFFYDRKILKKHYAPLPVISIGNVVAGGAGKTQAVLLLAEQLLGENIRIAILSRGYLGKAEHAKHPLHVDVDKHSVDLCGDEPWLLAFRLRSSFIVVNKNRSKCALKAEQLGAQLLVLDDGMQYRRLHRDYEIVVIDGKAPFGAFLPKGRLREDLSRLKTADLILFVGDPDKNIEWQVASLTSAPQVIAKIMAAGLFRFNDGEAIASIRGKSVAVFCGIGNPSRFVKTVEELGAHVVATHFTADHRTMAEKELQKFAAISKERGATLLLCTEKDKVKLSKRDRDLPLPIVWLRATLEIVKNREFWLKALNEMRLLAQRI